MPLFGGFEAGAIVARMTLNKDQWSQSIKAVKGDQAGVETNFKTLGERVEKFGKTLTIVGGAIVATMGYLVKGASDAEETYSKFGVVFGDVMGEANKAASLLAQNYGLSELAARTLLSATGDLLTGLGVTAGIALELSLRTQ